MKRLLLAACFALCFALPACQCSNPPDVGPVEGDADATHLVESSVRVA